MEAVGPAYDVLYLDLAFAAIAPAARRLKMQEDMQQQMWIIMPMHSQGLEAW